MKQIRILKVKRMNSAIVKRLEAFNFEIVWFQVQDNCTVIGYK